MSIQPALDRQSAARTALEKNRLLQAHIQVQIDTLRSVLAQTSSLLLASTAHATRDSLLLEVRKPLREACMQGSHAVVPLGHLHHTQFPPAVCQVASAPFVRTALAALSGTTHDAATASSSPPIQQSRSEVFEPFFLGYLCFPKQDALEISQQAVVVDEDDDMDRSSSNGGNTARRVAEIRRVLAPLSHDETTMAEASVHFPSPYASRVDWTQAMDADLITLLECALQRAQLRAGESATPTDRLPRAAVLSLVNSMTLDDWSCIAAALRQRWARQLPFVTDQNGDDTSQRSVQRFGFNAVGGVLTSICAKHRWESAVMPVLQRLPDFVVDAAVVAAAVAAAEAAASRDWWTQSTDDTLWRALRQHHLLVSRPLWHALSHELAKADDDTSVCTDTKSILSRQKQPHSTTKERMKAAAAECGARALLLRPFDVCQRFQTRWNPYHNPNARLAGVARTADKVLRELTVMPVAGNVSRTRRRTLSALHAALQEMPTGDAFPAHMTKDEDERLLWAIHNARSLGCDVQDTEVFVAFTLRTFELASRHFSEHHRRQEAAEITAGDVDSDPMTSRADVVPWGAAPFFSPVYWPRSKTQVVERARRLMATAFKGLSHVATPAERLGSSRGSTGVYDSATSVWSASTRKRLLPLCGVAHRTPPLPTPLPTISVRDTRVLFLAALASAVLAKCASANDTALFAWNSTNTNVFIAAYLLDGHTSSEAVHGWHLSTRGTMELLVVKGCCPTPPIRNVAKSTAKDTPARSEGLPSFSMPPVVLPNNKDASAARQAPTLGVAGVAPVDISEQDTSEVVKPAEITQGQDASSFESDLLGRVVESLKVPYRLEEHSDGAIAVQPGESDKIWAYVSHVFALARNAATQASESESYVSAATFAKAQHNSSGITPRGCYRQFAAWKAEQVRSLARDRETNAAAYACSTPGSVEEK